MHPVSLALSALLLLVIVAGLALQGRHLARSRHRTNALRSLMEKADQLESDLLECRRRLQQAHAAMDLAHGLPAPAQGNARKAVDAGLRSLLEHRLWIRDHAASASLEELRQAIHALDEAGQRMQPELAALGAAQRDLDQAVRERQQRENNP